jgi:hypothetical protein
VPLQSRGTVEKGNVLYIFLKGGRKNFECFYHKEMANV